MRGPRGRQGPISRCLAQMGRDLWLQGAALLSLTVSLAILGAYLVLCHNAYQALAGLTTGGTLTVVLEEGQSPAQARELGQRIAGLPPVASIRVISKEEGLKRFARQLGPHKGLLSGLTDNPLPDVIEVTLMGGGDFGPGFSAQIKSFKGVENVLTRRPWLARLERAGRAALELGGALGILLFLGVVFLVANTVRLAVYVRKDSMEIMELVGAGAWYVRLPFVLEALIQALVAAALASGVIWLLLKFLSAPAALPLGLELSALLAYQPALPLALGALAMVAGVVGGLWGAARALRFKGM